MCFIMSTSLLSVFSAESTKKTPDWQMIGPNETTEVPKQISMPVFQTEDWWENSNMDMNHNSIVDWLEDYEGDVKVGLSYDHTPSDYDIHILNQLGFNVNVELPIIENNDDRGMKGSGLLLINFKDKKIFTNLKLLMKDLQICLRQSDNVYKSKIRYL